MYECLAVGGGSLACDVRANAVTPYPRFELLIGGPSSSQAGEGGTSQRRRGGTFLNVRQVPGWFSRLFPFTAGCPMLTVLCTCRQQLRVQGAL